MQTDQIIIYQTTDGHTAIDLKLENEESSIKVINLLPLTFSYEV